MAELLDVESSRCVLVVFRCHDNSLDPYVRLEASIQKKYPIGAPQFLKDPHVLRLSNSLGSPDGEKIDAAQKKLLKVAIIGRPNAGKSTLINSLLKFNLCGVSHKTHTTRTPLRTAFTHGDTQVVFVDTPGLVTRKEYLRFRLSDEYFKWKQNVLDEADIIGIMHEMSDPRSIFKFNINLTQTINDFPESKPLFLVLNKIDLVIDKDALSATIDSFFKPENLDKPGTKKIPKLWWRFSRVFFTSALRNIGVNEIAEYLLEQAKPGEWLFEPDQRFDKPLDAVVLELVRAQLFDILPHEIPYQCEYEIEYLKEDSLGR